MNPAALILAAYRALPLLAVLAVVALAAYLVCTALCSPERAKTLLVKILTGCTGFLTVLFCAATAYAWLENNAYVLELMGGLAFVSALALGAIRLYARRLVRRRGCEGQNAGRSV